MSSFRRRMMMSNEKLEVIEFEDPIAKEICVSNWGGHYIDGEITTKEAAAVTTIRPTSSNRYFNGCQMTKFNEFKYFVGLTELSATNSANDGAFQGCTKLQEITLPKLNITSGGIFNGSIFRICRALEEVDLSPWATSVGVNLYCMFTMAGVTKVDLRPFKTISAASNLFACNATYPSKLEELNTEGCTFGATALSTSAFSACSKLTTIIGGFAGHKGSISLSSCPLTRESALVVLNSLATANSGATITFKASTYNMLTAEDKQIGIDKGYSIQ